MKRFVLLIIPLFLLTGCTVGQKSDSQNPDPKAGITFAVIGDNEGLNDTYTSFIKTIAKDNSIQFVIHVGDITANGGDANFKDTTQQLRNAGFSKPLYVAPGNHDITTESTQATFENFFGKVPRSIEAGSLHIILLDNSNRKIGFTDETLSWLKTDLEAAKGKTIVIAYHRPFGYPLASILGDDETKTSRASNVKFEEIISQYNIAAIFTGHIHTYFEYPFVIGSGKTEKTVPVYITGGGGEPPQGALSSLFQEKYHYLKVTFLDNKLTIDKIPLQD